MPITMQGNWTITVKSKEAAFAQRFVVSGATTGNGTYAGDVGATPVNVTGRAWSITVQHNPGSGFVNSADQIKFPVLSGPNYSFDIESDDGGGSDSDFNDLVLACTTAKTQTDFLIFGSVSTYHGRCYINPCFRSHIVIDTIDALREAVKAPQLRRAIDAYYADRVRIELGPRGPGPDPAPFRPLMVPLLEEAPIPAPKLRGNLLGQNQILARPKLDVEKIALAGLLDQTRTKCVTNALAGVVLRFQEYDRSTAELIGGPYTGAGNRENLGVCATDRNGNYIFRFSRTLQEIVQESQSDVAQGEDAAAQSLPDVIVQVLDSMQPNGLAFESAPHWNVASARRVDICFPRSQVPSATACQGQHAIQAIGNIFVGAPSGGGRVGFNNIINAEGRVTARNVMGPQTLCAAWVGSLDLFACFLDRPNVARYTIRWRRGAADPWKFFQQEYRHPAIAHIGDVGYNGDPIGPHSLSLRVDGGAPVTVPGYYNIESDSNYVLTHRNRKAQISSHNYAPDGGPVDFRIDGYDTTGAPVPGASDQITLFIDNNGPELDISSVTMAGQAGGVCALFQAPANAPNTPLTVTFKVTQAHGTLGSYGLGMSKGNAGGFAVTGASSLDTAQMTASYAHTDDTACGNQLSGTPGYVTVQIQPAAGGWLEPGQPFCTFVVNLGATTRVTNGYSSGQSHGPRQYFLGIQV